MNILAENKRSAKEYVAGERIPKYSAVFERGACVYRYRGGREEIVGIAIEAAEEGEKVLVASNGYRFEEDFENDLYFWTSEEGENGENFGGVASEDVFWLFRRVFGNVFEVQIGGGLND